MRHTAVALALAAIASVPGMTQGDARGIYVEGTKPALKYTVLLERDSARMEVPPNYAFRTGDRLKLKFDLSKDSYIYVLHRSLAGDSLERYAGTRGIEVVRDEDQRARRQDSWQLLYPRGAANSNTALRARRATMVPRDGWFRMDENPGMEKLILVVAPAKVRIENFFDPDTGKMRRSPDGDILGRLTRALLDYNRNSVASRGLSPEPEQFAGSIDPAAPMLATIDLKHSE